ncbi:MAG: outer membrane protein assembly factor BamD [Thermodesulfobacteriota bacterium]
MTAMHHISPLKHLTTSSLMFTLLFLLPGCGLLGSDETEEAAAPEATIISPAYELAQKGMEEFNTGDYYQAKLLFNEILDRHPFSKEATLAELKAADSNYHLKNWAEALILYKEFEERHPTNEAIPYVMYQVAMCSYKNIGRVDRDTSGATQTIRDFSRLLRAYPKSPYTREAKARILAAKEFLVNHEYFVVKFYIRTDKDSQAISRLKYILATYPTSAVAPKAAELLKRLEAGDAPGFTLSSWFRDLSLPDWHDYFKKGKGTDENGKQLN